VAGTLGGIVAGLWSYARSKRDGGTSSAVIAVVGAILMIYGVGLVGYRFADMYLTEISGVRLALVCFGLPLAVALASGWFVNINYISLHRFYRDRLMEAFLPDIAGALHQRTGPARAAD
jgi:phosphoglycerol transferase MdoB-like AlkP superfamily enzyme